MSSEHHRLPIVDLFCLAFHDWDRSTTLLSLSGHKRINAGDAYEFLQNKVICPTARGFLLVRDPDIAATFLWNPMDGDKVLLPHLEEVDDTVLMDSHCVLSDKPAAPGCIVVLVEFSANTLIWYCHPGDDQWVKYEYDVGTQVLPYPGEEDQHEDCHLHHGTLQWDKNIEKASVHRMDFSALRWRNVCDLGGRSFLVSRADHIIEYPEVYGDGDALPRLSPLRPLHGTLQHHREEAHHRRRHGRASNGQGFLLVRDRETAATFLHNPGNGDKVHLPPLHGLDDSVLMDSHCLLSDEPTATGCVVLLVEAVDNAVIWYVHPGDDLVGEAKTNEPLWRPQDDARIHLPPLDGIDDLTLMRSQCHLSDEPSAPGCVVVVVEVGDRDHTFIRYCHPGDDQWVKYDYHIGTQPALPDAEGNEFEKSPICPVAACRGKFYFNCTPTELGVLEFCPDPVFSSISLDDESCDEAEDEAASETEDEEEYECEPQADPASTELEVLDPAFSSMSIEESRDESEGELASEDEECERHETRAPAYVFHVESGGELYMVTLMMHVSVYDDGIAEFFVDKMDFSARQWRRVDDLGGRTFFLSTFYFGASCFCGENGGGLQQDCV
ncbi:hypothetical protein EJB05_18073, partial [Eragrostis curvula]